MMTPARSRTPTFAEEADAAAVAQPWGWVALPLACAGWLAFFAFYGPHGFNFRDDGYLLTLAERMLRGEVIYRDFAYLRPPLSVMIQAALLDWVPGYAEAASRWYLAGQVAIILLAVYALLGRVEPAPATRAFFALLAVVYAFTGGWPPTPWHTVDGIFFSVLTTWALVAAAERHSPLLALTAGLAAGAALLSKQGFVVVTLVGFALTLTAPGRRIGRRSWTGAAAYLSGAGLIATALLVYLIMHDALVAFAQSVIMAPGEITRDLLGRDAWFLLVRIHIPAWMGALVGLVFIALITLPMAGWVRAGLAGSLVAWLSSSLWLAQAGRRVQWHFLVQPVYTTIWVGAVGLLIAQAVRRVRLPFGVLWALALGLCTLYASSWSFVGIRLALGHVLALPVCLLTLVRRPAAGDGSLSADLTLPTRRFAAACLLVYVAVFMAFLQIAVPSLDVSRLDATVPFATDRLRGIRSSPLRVRGVDGVVDLVRRETAAGDPVLAFMDFPALYFLTGRRNPTRVDWFLPQELPMAEVRRALADLEARPPRLVILVALDPMEMLRHSRLTPIFGHILERYETGEAIGEFLVLRPRKSAATP